MWKSWLAVAVVVVGFGGMMCTDCIMQVWYGIATYYIIWIDRDYRVCILKLCLPIIMRIYPAQRAEQFQDKLIIIILHIILVKGNAPHIRTKFRLRGAVM